MRGNYHVSNRVLENVDILGNMASGLFIPRKRFTRADAERMADIGVITGRYELIEGDLIDKMGQKPPHAFTIAMLTMWLVKMFGGRVRVQIPIEVALPDRKYSEPEPDFAISREALDEYSHRHPRGDELLLLIEIGDTSARFDRTVKAKLYARAGVPEYWVVDLPKRMLHVYRKPIGEDYQQALHFREPEMISPDCMPEAMVSVSELLPPA